jgi:hypothetical protein
METEQEETKQAEDGNLLVNTMSPSNTQDPLPGDIQQSQS